MAKIKSKARKANGHGTACRSDFIRSLVNEHDIARDEVAKLASVSVHTVTAWLRSNDALSHREPKQHMIELLSLKTRKPLPRSLVA